MRRMINQAGRVRSVGLSIFMVALLLGCAQAQPPLVDGQERPMNRTRTVRAPELPSDLPWLNTDRPVALADLRGKVVLLDFWTYCCINCMHILPELAELERRFADELVVIGVHSAKFESEGETQNIRSAILRYGIEHPVLVDSGMRVWQSYAVRAWPTLVLIDPAGYVIGSHSGEITADGFAPVIEQAIAAARANQTLRPGPIQWSLEAAAEPRRLLSFPGKVLADAATDRLYIADTGHHRLLVCRLNGEVLQAIGDGGAGLRDGDLASAQFWSPNGMALVGDLLYVADTQNHSLRVVDLTAGQVRTLVGTGNKPIGYNQAGIGRAVALHSPWAVAAHDGMLYVANAGSHQIWAVDPRTGQAQPFAGSAREDLRDGAAGVAALAQPSGLALLGNTLYFADSETSSIRGLTLDPRPTVRTLIGQGLFDFGDRDGDRRTARLQHPLGLAAWDGQLYAADTYNNKIKRLDPATGLIGAFAGTGAEGAADGSLAEATFDEPGGLSAAAGRLYVADTNNHAIRIIDVASATVKTLALSNVEKARPPQSAGPPATELGSVTVGPDGIRLNLRLVPRAGFERTPGAPATVVATVDGVEQRLTVVPTADDLVFAIAAPPEARDLRLEAVAYFCTAGTQSVCEIATATWHAELVSAAATQPLQLLLTQDGNR